MKRLPKPLINLFVAGLLILLGLGGGLNYYLYPAWGVTLTLILLAAALVGLCLAASHLVGLLRLDASHLIFGLLLLALVISTLANLDIWPVSVGRLLLYLAAFGLIVGWRLDATTGLYWAALAWPVVWLLATLAGWSDNPNITAFWPLVFVLGLFPDPIAISGDERRQVSPFLARRYPSSLFLAMRYRLVIFGGIAGNLALLFYLGSRGAILGLALSLFLMGLPGVIVKFGGASASPFMARWSTSSIMAVSAVALPVIALALAACGPTTALYRLGYWSEALNAWSNHLLFGVGPGGLWARHIISEPGGGWQVHAHNLLVTWLAETGLTGLAALLVVAWCKRSQFTIHNPRFTILIALAAWSLVDSPLWWPGPLLAAVIILKTLPKFVTLPKI